MTLPSLPSGLFLQIHLLVQEFPMQNKKKNNTHSCSKDAMSGHVDLSVHFHILVTSTFRIVCGVLFNFKILDKRNQLYS